MHNDVDNSQLHSTAFPAPFRSAYRVCHAWQHGYVYFDLDFLLDCAKHAVVSVEIMDEMLGISSYY